MFRIINNIEDLQYTRVVADDGCTYKKYLITKDILDYIETKLNKEIDTLLKLRNKAGKVCKCNSTKTELVNITLTIPNELSDWLHEQKKEEGLNISALAVKLLRELQSNEGSIEEDTAQKLTQTEVYEQEVVLCDYCGKALPEDTDQLNNRIKLCPECLKRRNITYSKVWHEKNKELHNEMCRKNSQKYRESGKIQEAIERFWSKVANPAEKRAEYQSRYEQKKANELGISVTDVRKLSQAGLLKSTTLDNVQENLELAPIIASAKYKERYRRLKELAQNL